MTAGRNLTQSERERAARQAEKLRANLQKRKQQKRDRKVKEGDIAAVNAGVTAASHDTDPTDIPPETPTESLPGKA